MIKIENTETFGWEAAIRGMRNPMNSWDKSDSDFVDDYTYCEYGDLETKYKDDDYVDMSNMYICIGPNDLNLMKRLRNAGTDHRKYLRMITVYCDITAPLYWWKEFDTYKVGTVANSCSTMHKIQANEFTLDDFSHEHIFKDEILYPGKNKLAADIPHQLLCRMIDCLNGAREMYLKTKDKKYWWQMIQLLPSSYNQKRTVMLNYEVLVNIYKSRKNHKLDEWHAFCNWLETLPYSEQLITGETE